MTSIFYFRMYLTLAIAFIANSVYSQTQDFKVQHLQVDVPGSGLTLTAPSYGFTAVSNLNKAFIIISNNRRNGAGPNGNVGNMEARALSCTVHFTNTNTIVFSRGAGATITTRVNIMIVEYVGLPGGANEFIVRHRSSIEPTNGTIPQTLTMASTPANINKCIPFYSVHTSDTANGGAADSMIAFCSGTNTLNYHRGGAANTVTARVEVVEFTGINWTVGHGDSGSVGTDNGTIALSTSATGTGGNLFNVGSWQNALIWHTYKGDSNSGANEAIADNYPLYTPNATTSVDWRFDLGHDGVSERHFIHVLKNPFMDVTRFYDASNKEGESTVDISSVGLTNVNQAIILGTSISNGTGSAYGRGWRNYYFYSTTEAAHWAHRSGNTMQHELQIVDFVRLRNSPEIHITGNSVAIVDGDLSPSPTDFTLYGSSEIASPLSHIFSIQNLGSAPLTIGTITFAGSNPGDFSIPAGFGPATSIAAGGTTNFTINFRPTASGTRTALIRISNNDPNENPYDFMLEGTGLAALTEGPGGVTSNLGLWLKGTDGLNYTDGQRVGTWEDRGRGANAVAPINQVRPYFRDNITSNINFNPVVDFDNTYNPVPVDGDYSFDNPNTQFLQGPSGFYSQEIFVVLIPDVTINNNFGSMDVFCGDRNSAQNESDGTGIGFGNYSSRFNNEVLCYAVGTSNDYGAAQTGTGISYSNVGIINTRNNSAGNSQELFYNGLDKRNTQVNPATFTNVTNSRYWIGRSEGWEASTDARIAEIITYSSRKTDANPTQERNRIMSYLAIKYGITLGNNGTSQNYVNSAGETIWNQATNAGFNHDIAGIARDDQSDLNQKQSRSVNNASDGSGRTQGILTIGLSDIYATNTLNKLNNATTLNDKQSLVWGDNGVNLNTAASTITVNLSAGISPALTTNVSFTAMARVWKVVENGGDIPSVKLSIPQNAIRNITPPGRYFMFISNTNNFNATAEYRVMTPDGNGNLVTDYDFDDTKYITFGYAPQTIVERSIYFSGYDAKTGLGDYIDVENKLNLNPSAFTVSAWIKRNVATVNASIVSKRNSTFTQGYDLRINAEGNVEMIWKNSGTRSIVSSTIIPPNKWHQVAVTYSSGIARLYIDGVLDTSKNLSAPSATNESFYIGAAGKNAPTAHFTGNIDEVRVWDVALSVNQLRYIMNQEIIANGIQVSGKKLPSAVTKNEIASISWSKLSGYYPMSVYTFTNTEDASGNGNQGALKNLNTVDQQTAPLPYKSRNNGNWSTTNTWLNGTVQELPNSLSIVDGTPIDWNIVETSHNLKISSDETLLRSPSVLGLVVNSNTLTVDGTIVGSGSGNALTVTHYLKLNGTLDLDGESQLIQTLGSDLDVSSTGRLERDQQGSADTFTYNYWASPVGISNPITNNNTYTVADILKDGTNPNAPSPITFIGGYNGAAGTPIKLANYWIWKYANQPGSNYSKWQQTKSTGALQAGEGFTMKGPGTGAVTAKQNYVFSGKPNNGDIELTLGAGNDYLVGNPYASALDADQFISDNTMVITGTLYFWEHWGGGSHLLKQYEGGYAMYNFSGGVVAASINPGLGNTNPSVSNGNKMPTRFIPVSQGFFVYAQNGGKIKFNNGQRAYMKESVSTSVFTKTDANQKIKPSVGTITRTYVDKRMKFRVGLTSVKNVSRQLLLTADERATTGYDWGFDGPINDTQIDDIYWMIGSEKFAIQGINVITERSKIPLGLHTSVAGENTIRLDSLEHVPNTLAIYLYDKALEIHHDLRQSPYTVDLPKGSYTDRFEMVFSNGTTLGTPDKTFDDVLVYYANTSESIVLSNPNHKNIKSLELFNLLGQSVKLFTEVSNDKHSEYDVKGLSTGTYIIKLTTDNGVVSKKVMVK